VPDESAEQLLVQRLRAVIAAKDEQVAVLQAQVETVLSRLEAAAERERRLELRVAELERRLSMDSSDSGTPSSKEGIGAKAERKAREKMARQESERERSKERKRGGQPGHQGKWAAGQQARLLLAAPRPAQSLLELLRKLDPEVQAIYWQQMNPVAIPGLDARRTAEGELTRRGRPCSATQILAPFANSSPGLSGPGDVTLVETVLLRVAAGPRADGDAPAEHYGEIRDLLDYLERQGSEIATRARLEFLFTVLLDHFRPARALAAVLRADPEAFAEIVSAAYLPDGQARDDTVITAQRRNLSIIGITALNSWRTPPGIRADNSIDAAYLQSWVHKARELPAKTGHAKVGDKTIGRILAHAPADSEGIWPPESVRDLIEELGCDDLESGLLDGKISTGLLIRSPDCGGDADRAAAAHFRRWAGQATSQWRTAALLRTLAKYMEERARNQDRLSQEIQDLGP
jgi:hypothetical protein